jgi:LacI family transcriptional regulator, repressor for deo operon, udp, cdd, tsx, nupC, and nupG
MADERRRGCGRRRVRYDPGAMPPRRSRPTIADVAARAGVSRAAVSFAINDRPGVGDETRARILRAAEELGWRPSEPARALTHARSDAVGLVLVRQPDRLEFDDFFVRFLTGIERTLAARDYGLLLQVLSLDVGGTLEAYRRLVDAGRVDGMLLTDVVLDDPRYELLLESGMPTAVAGRPLGNCSFPSVELRHLDGMAAVVEHLIALGHRAVAFIGGDPAYEYVATRRAVWMNTMRRAGLEPGLSASVVPEDAVARAATARLLRARHRPTAIVYTSDMLALAGIHVARRLGLDVPGDVSIVGFDDSPVADLSSPPLTTVRVDYAGFGEAAAALLLALIEGAPPPLFEPAAPELVVRGSTAPRPSEPLTPARQRASVVS